MFGVIFALENCHWKCTVRNVFLQRLNEFLCVVMLSTGYTILSPCSSLYFGRLGIFFFKLVLFYGFVLKLNRQNKIYLKQSSFQLLSLPLYSIPPFYNHLNIWKIFLFLKFLYYSYFHPFFSLPYLLFFVLFFSHVAINPWDHFIIEVSLTFFFFLLLHSAWVLCRCTLVNLPCIKSMDICVVPSFVYFHS